MGAQLSFAVVCLFCVTYLLVHFPTPYHTIPYHTPPPSPSLSLACSHIHRSYPQTDATLAALHGPEYPWTLRRSFADETSAAAAATASVSAATTATALTSTAAASSIAVSSAAASAPASSTMRDHIAAAYAVVAEAARGQFGYVPPGLNMHGLQVRIGQNLLVSDVRRMPAVHSGSNSREGLTESERAVRPRASHDVTNWAVPGMVCRGDSHPKVSNGRSRAHTVAQSRALSLYCEWESWG